MAGIPGVKEGSIIEGILAMYCALVLMDPDNGSDSGAILSKINSMRVDTGLSDDQKRITLSKQYPKDNDFGFPTVNITQDQIPLELKGTIGAGKYFQQTGKREGLVKPPDFIRVGILINLKPKESAPAYGKSYLTEYLERGLDYGNLAKKVNALLKNNKSMLYRKLIVAKNRFLKNNRSDFVEYQVISDGVAGEQQDNIKADMSITVKANGQVLDQFQIDISVKSESTTVANLGIVDGLTNLYSLLGVKPQDKVAADKILSEINALKGEAKLESCSMLFQLIARNIKEANGNPDMTGRLFRFLEGAIFGRDFAQVVDIQKAKVKEIDISSFRSLESFGGKNGGRMKLIAMPTAGDIRFVPEGNPSSKFLFKFRIKRRNYKPPKEGKYVEKIMLEVGPVVYS